MKSLSHVRLLATPWTAAYQAPLSMDSPGKNTGVGCHLDSIVLYNFLKFHVHDFMQSHDGGLVAKSCLALATPWTIACQAPLSMGFSRLEYWSGCHFLLQRIFQTQESNQVSCIASRFFTNWAMREAHNSIITFFFSYYNSVTFLVSLHLVAYS